MNSDRRRERVGATRSSCVAMSSSISIKSCFIWTSIYQTMARRQARPGRTTEGVEGGHRAELLEGHEVRGSGRGHDLITVSAPARPALVAFEEGSQHQGHAKVVPRLPCPL